MEGRLSIYLETIIKQIKIIERFGTHVAFYETCETLAGMMSEQINLYGLALNSNDERVRNFAKKFEKERFYSAHFEAMRDVMRLCKLINELIEQANDYIEASKMEV